jgi:8-oxo-dGTP pyrophosphatase MutT (NUDIX family)
MPIRAAAVCYRRTAGGPEFLLVRTRNGQAWTFPKGHLERRESTVRAAEREAREEAAASGRIAPTAFTRYRYPAWVGPGFPAGEVCIEAYLMEVTSLSRDGSAERRRTSWFAPEVAVWKLAEGRNSAYAREHARVIAAAVAALQGQPEPGQNVPADGSEP